MAKDFYQDIAADYDRMIRWERRLAVERPQFDALIRKFAIRSALDASCGSGHHLVLLHSIGIDVFGTDASCAMLELARDTLTRAGLPPEGMTLCATWQELPRAVTRTFDLVLCIGNSLPYVVNPNLMRVSLAGLWSRVAPGGMLIVQYKNFVKLMKTRQRFLPLSYTKQPEERIALRIYDYLEDRIDFNVFLLDKAGDEWTVRHHVTPLKPYAAEEVMTPLREWGAEVSPCGSLGLEPYNADESEDVVIVARRIDSSR